MQDVGLNAQTLAKLTAFAQGQQGADEVKECLGLDSDEELFLLMMRAELPMPRLDDATTAAMVSALHQLDRGRDTER